MGGKHSLWLVRSTSSDLLFSGFSVFCFYLSVDAYIANPKTECIVIKMKNLTATICLTIAVLLGFVLGIAWMSIGNDALDGEYLRALKTMGGSGINWIDAIFRYCVVLLVNIAKVLGISYEALNIWVFIIIQPMIIVVLLGWVLKLQRKVKKVR